MMIAVNVNVSSDPNIYVKAMLVALEVAVSLPREKQKHRQIEKR